MDESTLKRLIDSPPDVVKDTVKSAMVAYCEAFRSARTFLYEGSEYHYLYHPYNLAWRNERSVEVPIASKVIGACGSESVLEVGNVLGHYGISGQTVLDKYETGSGVINEDAREFDTDQRFGLIVSISTLEHVGMDDGPERGGPLEAIENLRRLLSPGGLLFATAPVGLNPAFDRLLEPHGPFDETSAMVRTTRGNDWVQAPVASVLGTTYNRKTFRARAIAIGRLYQRQDQS